MNTIQVELTLGPHGIWSDAYARPARNRDLVSAGLQMIPPADQGCLQNVIVDLREVPPERLPQAAAGIVYRVAGIEVSAKGMLTCPEALRALEVETAQTWVNLSERSENIPGLLTSGWQATPRRIGISVRSASLDSVRTWLRVAQVAGMPLRFVWQGNGKRRNTVDLLTSLGIFAFSPAPAVLGIDPGAAAAPEIDRLFDLVCSGLRALGLRRPGIQLVSCPACARTKVNLRGIAARVWEAISELDADLCVAVMGCEVNGPGEARMADLGVACGKGIGLIFREGKVVRRVPESEIVPAMVEEAVNILRDRASGKESRQV